MGGNIFGDLSLFVLLYNTIFMNQLKFNEFSDKFSVISKIIPYSPKRKGGSN